MLKFQPFLLLFLLLATCCTTRPQAQAALEKPSLIEMGHFDEDNVNLAISQLRELKAAGATNIWIRIDSSGGSVFDGSRLIKEVEALRMPITCVVDFKAHSMAFNFLEAACSKRLATKRSTFMMHGPGLAEVSGNAKDFALISARLKVAQSALAELAAKRMKLSKDEILKKLDTVTEWWMTWEEALEAGAIDGTIEPEDIPATTVLKAKPASQLEDMLKKLLKS
jgi:ATP-dependent protease ClpP protease subunit